MGEIRKRVIPIEVTYQCEKCGEGFMEDDSGAVIATYPPLYLHKCTKCGYREVFSKRYPMLEYEDAEVGK